MSMTSPRVLVLPPLSTPSQLTILNERTRIHHLRVEFFGGLKFSSQVGSNNVTFTCVFHTHFIQIWDDTYQRILQATSRLWYVLKGKLRTIFSNKKCGRHPWINESITRNYACLRFLGRNCEDFSPCEVSKLEIKTYKITRGQFEFQGIHVRLL